MKPDVNGFDVEVIQTDVAAVLRLVGELDIATAPTLRDELLTLIERGIHAVTVDLAGLDFIDSTGLGVLISAMKRLRSAGGDMVLQSPNPTAQKIFDITGMSKSSRSPDFQQAPTWVGSAELD